MTCRLIRLMAVAVCGCALMLASCSASEEVLDAEIQWPDLMSLEARLGIEASYGTGGDVDGECMLLVLKAMEVVRSDGFDISDVGGRWRLHFLCESTCRIRH